MALCLPESLVEMRRFDPVDQLERYERWWRVVPARGGALFRPLAVAGAPCLTVRRTVSVRRLGRR
jgi:hypothetical protein